MRFEVAFLLADVVGFGVLVTKTTKSGRQVRTLRRFVGCFFFFFLVVVVDDAGSVGTGYHIFQM